MFPPTFRDEQETLGALPFIFFRLPTNRHLSETVHTPVPGELNFVPKVMVPQGTRRRDQTSMVELKKLED